MPKPPYSSSSSCSRRHNWLAAFLLAWRQEAPSTSSPVGTYSPTDKAASRKLSCSKHSHTCPDAGAFIRTGVADGIAQHPDFSKERTRQSDAELPQWMAWMYRAERQ